MINYQDFVKVLLNYRLAYPVCSFNFDDPKVLSIWFDNLKDFTREELLSVFKEHIQAEKYFPSISDFHKYARAKPCYDTLSEDLTGKILSAISQYGYMNAKSAKESLGEVAWEAVSRNGGWQTICDITNERVTFLSSQLRRSVFTILEMKEKFPNSPRLEERGTRTPLLDQAMALLSL